MTEPKPENPCFGCGGANPRGMRLIFDRDDARQRIVGRFCLGPEYQGGAGFIHGGIIATVLDEVMSKVSALSNVRAVTADLRVEYLKPIRIDEELLVEGFATRREGRQLYHEGEIRDSAGVLLARGQGRFVVIDRAMPHPDESARMKSDEPRSDEKARPDEKDREPRVA